MAHTFTLPGTVLAQVSNASQPGYGTHIYADSIIASLSGPNAQHKSQSSQISKAKAKATTSYSVQRPQTAPLLPEVTNTVLARITRLTPRSATCSILAIYPASASSKSQTITNSALPSPPRDVQPVSIPPQAQFSGQIRSQDVRATEKDKVVMGEAFRVGDVVRAVVISLGDQRDYYLSTAGNEFGVLLAWSASDGFGGGGGRLMEPVSWQEMRDPVTGIGERRKVAKTV